MHRVMATPTTLKSLSGSKIKYDASDAVALMPLLVGFKPAGRNNDLGIIDPLCTYRPPNADVMRQSWKLHNIETINAVAAAMRKCGTSCLFALNYTNASNTLRTPVPIRPGLNTAEIKERNNYMAVLGRIDKIEGLITKVLTDATTKNMIAKNAATLRSGTISALQGKLKMADSEYTQKIMKEFIKQNSLDTERQMRQLFDLPNPDSRPWAGLCIFDDFWKNVIESPTASTNASFTTNATAQEVAEIDSFVAIIKLHKKISETFTNSIQSEFQKKVQTKYLNRVYDENIPENTKVDADRANVNRYLNKYLWNVILERLEILDSTVSTYFSQICATRNVHVPLVMKFMQHAIFHCVAPLFSCITKPVIQADSLNNKKVVKDILDALKDHSDAFKLFLEAVFSTTSGGGGMTAKITELSGPESRLLQTHIYDRLLHTTSTEKVLMLGPRVDIKERTPIYVEIEKLIEKKLATVPEINMKTYIPNIESSTPALLSIYRTTDIKYNPVTAIRDVVGNRDAITDIAKQIAYIRLYLDSVAYGVFHYEKYDEDSLKLYMTATNNPLSISTGEAAKDKANIDTHAKNKPISPYLSLLTAAPNAAILKALNLKPDFNPSLGGGKPNQNQGAGGGGKKKNNNNKNNKKKNKNKDKKKDKTPAAKTTIGKKNNKTPPRGQKQTPKKAS